MTDVKPDWENTENFDAEAVKEAISEGDQPEPKVDVSADYEASKEMSGGVVDAETAEKMVAPQLEMPEPMETKHATGSDSNPEDYKDMAKDVSPAPQGTSNVTDNLVEKAIEKGQSAKK